MNKVTIPPRHPALRMGIRLLFLGMIVGLFTIAGSAQQKQTVPCTMNGKVYESCHPLSDGRCEINGQTFAICEKPAQPAKCPEGGPLIIKLNAATNYYERFSGYTLLNDNLKCRQINMGFFGAASDVTYGFNIDEKFLKCLTGGFSEMADKFLGLASTGLVTLNAGAFNEIAKTGKLTAVNPQGYLISLTNPIDMDSEMIRREQVFVENGLIQLGPYRNAVVANINARVKFNLDGVPLGASLKAMAQVRNEMRVMFPGAEFDFGNIYHRMRVGQILAARHRK